MTGTVIAGLLASLWPSQALASEDDRSFSLSAGYGTYFVSGQQPDGLVLGADYERGFSETMAFRMSGGIGGYWDDQRTYSAHATAGLTYLFDVLKYVPYANIGIGGLTVVDEEFNVTPLPLIEMGLGLEILRSRDFSWGVLTRFEYWLDQNAFYTLGARATWRWGFF